MKKIVIEETEYMVPPLLPWQIPLLQRYLSLVESTPTSIEQAEKTGSEIKKLLEMLLRNVTPQPPEEHYVALINAINYYTRHLNRETRKFFRVSSKKLSKESETS